MVKTLLKLLFRTRFAVLAASLVLVSSFLSTLSAMLFASTASIPDTLSNLYCSVPSVDRSFSLSEAFSNASRNDYGMEQSLLRQNMDRELAQAFCNSSYLAKDDRRAYLGYMDNSDAMRSPVKQIEENFYRYAPGEFYYEAPYRDVIAVCTLLHKTELASTSFSVFDASSTEAADLEAVMENIVLVGMVSDPHEYLYEFLIEELLAQNSIYSYQNAAHLYIRVDSEFTVEMMLSEGDHYIVQISDMKEEAGDFFTAVDGSVHSIVPDGPAYRGRIENENRSACQHVQKINSAALDCTDYTSFRSSSGLPDAEAKQWYEKIENYRKTTNAFYVITTDNYRSILPFAANTMYLIDGEGIVPNNTDSVCIISGELATAQNLRVGDTIDITLFRSTCKYYYDNGFDQWCLLPQRENENALSTMHYRIVGIYHSLGWEEYEYRDYLSPNTIFVSASSTPDPDAAAVDTVSSLPYVLWGFYLKDSSGAADFLSSLPEFTKKNVSIIDQGYSSFLQALIQKQIGTARTFLLLAMILSVVLYGVAGFLYYQSGKRDYIILRDLGLPSQRILTVWNVALLTVFIVCAVIGDCLGVFMIPKLELVFLSNLVGNSSYGTFDSEIIAAASNLSHIPLLAAAIAQIFALSVTIVSVGKLLTQCNLLTKTLTGKKV